MLGWCFTVTMCSVLAAPSTEQGTITGAVVNGLAQGEVVPGATVVLRAQNQGDLLPAMRPRPTRPAASSSRTCP